MGMDGHQFPTLSLTDKMTQADNGGEFMAKVRQQYETLQHQLDNTSPELLGNRASQDYGAIVRTKRSQEVKGYRIPRDRNGNRSTTTQRSAKSYNESTSKWSHIDTSFKWTVEVQPALETISPSRNYTVYRNDRVSESIIESLATLEQFMDDNGEDITAEFRTMYFDLSLCRTERCQRCKPLAYKISQQLLAIEREERRIKNKMLGR
jgi:hypothetical protein